MRYHIEIHVHRLNVCIRAWSYQECNVGSSSEGIGVVVLAYPRHRDAPTDVSQYSTLCTFHEKELRDQLSKTLHRLCFRGKRHDGLHMPCQSSPKGYLWRRESYPID